MDGVAVQAHSGMLQLARESREMTQAAVAEAMGQAAGSAVSQGYVSRAEAGRVTVSGERLALYAAALGFPPSLLCLDPQVHGVGVGLVHHRKRAALSAGALRRIHAELALTRLQLSGLAAAARRDLACDIPQLNIDTATSPQEAAGLLRKHWGLPAGPVEDLTGTLEAAGALVLVRDLGSDLLDAVSQWDGVAPPLVLMSAHTPADRCRFSLAHELAHLVLHRSPGPAQEQERQADAFASAFLMPAEDIRPELSAEVDLARLVALKQRWRVSMAALLRRARDLNAITEWAYRSAVVEMSALGYRTTEPAALAPERPGTVPALVAQAAAAAGSMTAAAACAHLLPEDFTARYAPRATRPAPLSARTAVEAT